MLIKKFRQSLTIKIFFITSILLSVACFATYGFISSYMPLSYSIALERDLEQNINELIKALAKVNQKDAGELLKNAENKWGIDIYLFDPTDNEKVEIPGHDSASNKNAETSQSITNTTDTDTVVAGSSITLSDQNCTVTFADSDRAYSLAYSTSFVDTVNQASMVLKSILPWLIIMVTIVALLGAVFYSWYVTRPILRISNISKKMANMEFEWKCQERRTDEIGVLAGSLNEMSSNLYQVLTKLQEANASLQNDIELERKLEQQRLAFFSAVSHELKTPLTIIKGQLEGMIHNIGAYQDRDKFLVRSLKVTDDMTTMIQQIMTISKMDSSQFQMNKSSFNFSKLVETQINKAKDLCLQKNQTISTNIKDNIIANGDPVMIEKVISNLISNGAHYSPENADIHIELNQQENGICFSIENTKTHIPDTDLPNIFQAFYRVEKSRNRRTGGSGLGLYLVKMILDQHEAAYHIENTVSGVQFTLILP